MSLSRLALGVLYAVLAYPVAAAPPQAFDRENTKAAVDRVRGAVKRLDEIQDEFFSAGLRARGEGGRAGGVR